MLAECRDAENQIGKVFLKFCGWYDLYVWERCETPLVLRKTMRYALFMSTYRGFLPPSRNVTKPSYVPPPRMDDSNEGQVNMLAEELTKLRAKGLTWAQIEVETGIPAVECAPIVNTYLRKAHSGTSVLEARQLQIMRLEMLMEMLYNQVEDGDLLSQGRQTANLIATINQVTELLDLRKDRLRDEQIRVTQEQGGLILHILKVVEMNIIETVLQAMTDASIYNTDTGKREIPDAGALRALVERDWSGWFANAADAALTAASGDSNDSVADVPAAVPSVPSVGGRIVRGALD